MRIFLASHPSVVLYTFYSLVFTLLSIWEALKPRRPLGVSRTLRWPHNFAIFLFNAALLQLLTTTTIANLAYIAWKNGWGLLNHLSLPKGLSFGISFLALDLVAYAQHRLFHKIPLAWRFHRAHHSDLELDVTTGPRFHPFESLASFAIRQLAVLLLGLSFASILVFDFLILIASMFNHANIRLSGGLDRVLRLFLITPDFHRIHHSSAWTESNSNFGFIFPWWDHLSGTYLPKPRKPYEKMRLGLAEFQTLKYLKFQWLLAFPFLKKDGPDPGS